MYVQSYIYMCVCTCTCSSYEYISSAEPAPPTSAPLEPRRAAGRSSIKPEHMLLSGLLGTGWVSGLGLRV